MKSNQRVVIVGGGISGLTAAYRLQSLLPDGAVVTLVDAAPRVGGTVSTQREDGYLVESGPDSFLTRKPETEALCTELGLAERFIEVNANARRAFVVRNGRLRRLPQGMSGLVPMKTGPLLLTGSLSLAAKARVLMERAVPQRKEGGDESVASFFRRRFGAEAFDRLIEPLVSGIFAGDADELSVQAVLPQLAALERDLD